MTKSVARPSKKFQNFNDAANQMLKLLSNQININTLFIAENDGKTNKIKKAFNRDEELVSEGSVLPLEQTFCNLVINNGSAPLKIENISRNKDAYKLAVAHEIENGSFIGVPVFYEDGEVYGTICGLDNDPFNFNQDHLEIFETISSLLTYFLELQKAQREIQMLSYPVIPVADRISVLNIIGTITPSRIQRLIDDLLGKVGKEIDYLIIDFSGVIQIDSKVEKPLIDLVNTLKLMGITPVITGISPIIALEVSHFAHFLKEEKVAATLKTAIGQLTRVISKKR